MATIVEFTGANVNDIPNGLRSLSEQPGMVNVAWVSILEDGTVQVGCLGRIESKFHALGILQVGIQRLGES